MNTRKDRPTSWWLSRLANRVSASRKKKWKKGRGYCPIHRTNAHDLIECKVMRGTSTRSSESVNLGMMRMVRIGSTLTSQH